MTLEKNHFLESAFCLSLSNFSDMLFLTFRCLRSEKEAPKKVVLKYFQTVSVSLPLLSISLSLSLLSLLNLQAI